MQKCVARKWQSPSKFYHPVLRISHHFKKGKILCHHLWKEHCVMYMCHLWKDEVHTLNEDGTSVMFYAKNVKWCIHENIIEI